MAFKEFNESKFSDTIGESSVILENGIVVLELFTSQGCSSCPPADVQLERAKNEYPENVFALSYHVDYWNYIGWEDPFSSRAFTIKQQAYNKKFESKSNYTPQLVINGVEHFVGSNGAKLTSKIHQYRNKIPENTIKTVGTREEDRITFKYDIGGNLKNKKLRAVLVLDERTTQVKRGENKNRTLKNANIVIAEKYLEILSSKGSGFIEIPKTAKENEKISFILLIEKNNMEITGAEKVEI
jgi:hypothetical protein